jgi:hypothetical protein
MPPSKQEEIEKIRDEVVKIISNSKATFFVNKGQKCINIPTDEALYELKAEIYTNVEMYFVNLLEKFNKK